MERKPASDEATGSRQQTTGEGPACRGGSYPEGEPPARSEESPVISRQSPGDAAIQSLPLEGKAAAPEALTDEVATDEADVSSKDADTPKRVARLETLRRWMLILAALLLIGGYAADCLPVLYASAVPLAVALIVTYRIKHLEEAAGK